MDYLKKVYFASDFKFETFRKKRTPATDFSLLYQIPKIKKDLILFLYFQ